MPTRRLIFAWLAIAFSILGSSPCYAQRGQLYQYATKFVCGAGDELRAVQGRYLTAVNIHNPGDNPALFAWKVANALPLQGTQDVSAFTAGGLKADGAGDIVCKQILGRVHQSPQGFATGFVVIESRTPLDVVAVYTATDPSGRSISIDVKATDARMIPPHRLPDLIVDGACNQSAQINGDMATAVIKNQGGAAAGPSVTRFTFTPSSGGASTSADVATPALAAGASATVSAKVPGNCFQPNCKIDVRADATNVVAESDESNNFDAAVCIGSIDPARLPPLLRSKRRSSGGGLAGASLAQLAVPSQMTLRQIRSTASGALRS